MKNKGLASLVSKGRNGDDHVAHLQTGEMVVPAPLLSDELKAQLFQEMLAAGIDPNEYTVGGEMSINPETGLPEFGLGKSIKKAFKSVKKAVSGGGLSGLLSIAAPFALGPAGLGLTGSSLLGASAAVGGGLGALSGNGLKGVLGGAITGAAGGGLGSYLGTNIASATGLSGFSSEG